MRSSYILALVFLNFCQSQSKNLSPTSYRDFYNKTFVDENTLQLVITKPNDFKEEPLVYKRKRLCEALEKEIYPRLHEAYPKSKKLMPKAEIKHILYLEDGGCQLIVHYHDLNLKKEIQ